MTYRERIAALQSKTEMDIELFCKNLFRFELLAKGEPIESLEEEWQKLLDSEEVICNEKNFKDR